MAIYRPCHFDTIVAMSIITQEETALRLCRIDTISEGPDELEAPGHMTLVSYPGYPRPLQLRLACKAIARKLSVGVERRRLEGLNGRGESMVS